MKAVIFFFNSGRPKLRDRGQKFWDWVKPDIHSRYRDEKAADGSMINVQVRTADIGSIELFVGVYDRNGSMLFEESYEAILGQTMTQAMELGIEKARSFLKSSSPALSPARKSEALPRETARRPK